MVEQEPKIKGLTESTPEHTLACASTSTLWCRQRVTVTATCPPSTLTNVLAGGGDTVGAGRDLGEVDVEGGVLHKLVLGEIHLRGKDASRQSGVIE